MKYAFFNDDCYNLYTITTSKFLTGKIEIVFVSDYSKESLTYLNLLSYVLLDSTKTYPSNKDLIRKLESLYNTKINMTNTRIGKIILTSLSLEFLDTPLFNDENLDEALKLLFEIINNPNTNYNAFEEEIFIKAKRKASNDIITFNNDKKNKTIVNALEMVDNKVRGINIFGDKNILDSIGEKKLLNFYKSFLEDSLKNIYYIGSRNEKLIKKIVQKYQKFNSIQTKKYDLFLEDDLYKLRCKNYKGKESSDELKIVQIYSFLPLNEIETNYILPLFNIIFSGSQDSVVFKKLREIEGLTYNVDSFYQKYDKLIILNTMCSKNNYRNALKIINSCINDIKKGNLSDDVFESSKKLLLTSYNLIYDDLDKILENYMFNTMFNTLSFDEKQEIIRNITKKDVVNIAKKIKLLVNYVGGE